MDLLVMGMGCFSEMGGGELLLVFIGTLGDLSLEL